MKQISAVEWLVEKLKENGVSFWQEEIEMIEEAKEMEKNKKHYETKYSVLTFEEYKNSKQK